MKQQKLKEFYQNYFQFNYCRDLRIIYPSILYKKENKVKTPPPKTLTGYKYPKDCTDLDMPDTFYKFLFKHRKGKGNCFYELSNYKHLINYRNKSKSQPYCDRLYFDLDGDDPRLNQVKEELTRARHTLTGKKKILAEKKAKNNFKNLLLNTDVLLPTFTEAMKLYKYLTDSGVKCYILFSGSKGFALNIFFKPLALNNINNISYNLATGFKEDLNLRNLDLVVNTDPISRLQRIVYTTHPNTGLMNQPIPGDISFDEFRDIIKDTNPKIADFDITEYYNGDDFTTSLLKYDKVFAKFKAEAEANKAKTKPAKFEGNAATIFQDMRVLWDYLASKGLVQPVAKTLPNYSRVHCPFHDDNTPSAIVSQYSFTCYGCGYVNDSKLNYFEFLRKLFNLSNDEDVKGKMREILKDSSL